MGGADVSARPAIVITRARRRLDHVERLAARHGLALLWLPVVETRPNPRAVYRLRRLLGEGAFDWIAVTSAQAVPALAEAWTRRFGVLRRLRPLPRIAAVGPATARRLRAHGLRVALVGGGPGGRALARAILDATGSAPVRVLWPRSTRPNREFSAELRRSGARVVEVAAYSTVATNPAAAPALAAAVVSGRVAALCFTAPSIVRAARRRLPAAARAHLGRVVLASFGPRTTAELRREGFEPRLERADGDLAALLQALIRAVSTRPAGWAA